MKKEWFFDRFCGRQFAALVEDGRLAEFSVEREDYGSIVGNVYKGKVVNVLSGMNAFLLSASRLCYAMSNADAIPKWFGKVDHKTQVPKNALVLLTVLSLAAPFLGRQVINWVVDMTSVGASLSFAYACAAALKLARQDGDKKAALTGAVGLALSIFFLGLLLIPGAPGFLSKPSLWALILWLVLGVDGTEEE